MKDLLHSAFNHTNEILCNVFALVFAYSLIHILGTISLASLTAYNVMRVVNQYNDRKKVDELKERLYQNHLKRSNEPEQVESSKEEVF